MKKFIIVAVALFTSLVGAQSIKNYGLKGGLSFSQLSFSANTQVHTKVGVYAGMFGELSTSAKGAWVGEALISLQGAKTGEASAKQDISITQLNIPIYYKYMASDKLAINGGGYFGLILGSKVAGVQFPNNTIDLGLIAGLSYKLNEKFALDARYNFGLLEVSDGVPAKNRFVTAGVSYLLK